MARERQGKSQDLDNKLALVCPIPLLGRGVSVGRFFDGGLCQGVAADCYGEVLRPDLLGQNYLIENIQNAKLVGERGF